MTDTDYAVTRLTETHTRWIDGQEAVSDPLLTVLKEARYPSLGKGSSRGGTGGDMLNQKAVTTYEHIDGTVRAWLNHYRQHSTGDLLALTKRLHETLQAEDAGGRLDDRDRMLGMFQQFVTLIEDCLDPPAEKELMGECPDCGETHVIDEEGQQKRAVRVPVKAGRALVAECFACGKLWAGQDALTGLAEAMGLEVDFVALREATDTQEQDTAKQPNL